MTGIIFLLLAIFCQNPNHTQGTHNCPLIHVTQVSTLDDGDDNGDTGHVPPKPPPPPPPPTNP